MNRSRSSPSSPRLPVCRSIQFDLPMRLDSTKPNCELGSSGVVELVLGSVLPDTLRRGETLAITLNYMLSCMLMCVQCRDLLSFRCQLPGNMRVMVGGL